LKKRREGYVDGVVAAVARLSDVDISDKTVVTMRESVSSFVCGIFIVARVAFNIRRSN